VSTFDPPKDVLAAIDLDVQEVLSDVLVGLLGTRLDAERWQRVEALLVKITKAISAGDNDALRCLLTDLDMTRSRSLAALTTPSLAEPAPSRVLMEVNELAKRAWLSRAAWADIAVSRGSERPAQVADEGGHVRYVNSVLAHAGSEEAVPPGQPLVRGTDYELLVNIGMPRPQSLLPASEHTRWPDEKLPGGNLRLRAVLRLDTMPRPLAATFTLPERGESFACECPPEGEHLPRCAPSPWVRFLVTTPDQDGRWCGELIIYYQVVAVHAQRLVLPVGGPPTEGPHASLLYRLTASFSNLGSLSGRAASILLAPGDAGRCRVTVNGLGFGDSPYSVGASAADNAYRAARESMYYMQIAPGPPPASLYSATYGKSPAEFEADLKVLARVGAEVYGKVFGDVGIRNLLQALIRQQAGASQRPPILCVAEPASLHQDAAGIPWSLLYDLPIGASLDDYAICESVRVFGPQGDGGPVPPQCPVGHSGQSDVVCPWGFWGLSSVLEQPPSFAGDATSVVTSGIESPAFLFAAGTGLDPAITARHLSALQADLGEALRSVEINSKDVLARALSEERLDVAYLYCHCGYQHLTPRSVPSQLLIFGDAKIGPLDVSMWASAIWSNPHWPTRKPLIVLNGCHTVEASSATLSSFVDAFVRDAGAGGVLGSEVAMEQGLASLVLETFLRRFAAGATVGQALREVRWDLFRRGNVMGLAYTAYCLSGLRIRPTAAAERNEE
jgi:hypothetical protein